MSRTRFEADTISDQKRLVRGEHLLLARSLLRARDNRHNQRWRVLMLAGGAPAEEIGAIRELLPQAIIVAVDKDQKCVELAQTAGADVTAHGDLQDPATLGAHEPFDIVHMDLCGGVGDDTRELFRQYSRDVSAGGVFIGTFSFGRDVVEAHAMELAKWRACSAGYDPNDRYQAGRVSLTARALAWMEAAHIPEGIKARLCMVMSPGMVMRTLSVMAYRGQQHTRHTKPLEVPSAGSWGVP